jgi:hypothetical protein
MKVILLEDDNAYEHLMQDFKKVDRKFGNILGNKFRSHENS